MKKLALCIGINDFPGTQNDLAGCVSDAQDWKTVLTKRGFDVKMFLDKQATKSAIIKSITEMLTTTAQGDSIVITNSTHGTQIPDTSGDEVDKLDEAICVIGDDGDKIDLIIDDQLWALFKLKKPGVRLVWLADSCHSGTVTRFFGEGYKGKRRFLPWPIIRDIVSPPIEKREVSFERDEERSPWPCLLIAGCQDNEYCYDTSFNDKPNGAFTRLSLDALANLRPTATYTDWFTVIKQVLPSRDYPQTPNMIGSYLNTPIFS